uniref:Fibronectin type-III domain-containing protein n=1 Tax=Timema douglasi TaxID=61478 RepID=A0A7R8VY45_TIMDO|nr:unnamed protein product [Timema douglasi]
MGDDTMITSAQVVNVSTSELSVSWVPVYPGSPCALGYQVCWAVYRTDVSRDVTEFTVTGLQSGTSYDFEVVALFEGNQMSLPYLLSGTTAVCESRLSTLIASEVHWTCLTSPSCTLDYDVCWTDLSSGNSSGCTPTGEISDSTPSFIIPGLNSCTDYNITVSTTTAGGTYFEASALARTPATARSLRSLTASDVLDSSFVLNWEILDDSVRCGHALDICATSTVSNDRYCSLNATGNQWQVTGLQPCSRYNVGATLTVDSQVLPPKNLSVFTASYNSTMIQSAQVVSVSTSEISISWIPVYPGSPCALGYRVCWGVKGADISLQICRSNLSTDATSFTIAQLQSDTNYDITLEAWLGGGVFSEQWSSDALTNVGSPVTSLRVKSVNTYSFEVHWTCLTSPSCTLDYDVCWTDLSSGNSSGCTPTGEISDSTPSFIIPGLNSCTDYNITVSTTTAGGTYFEASVRARTPATARSLRSLTASDVLDSSFVLNWEILDDSARCGHALDICATSTVSNDRYCSLNATGNQWQVTGLQPCSRYNVGATLTVDSQVLPPKNLSVFTASYKIAVEQGKGAGYQKPIFRKTAPEHHPAILATETETTRHKLIVKDGTMIQSAQVVSVSTSEISISWIPVYPGSPCALGYRVCWGVKGADISLQICRSNLSTDATSFTIAQLQSDTNYDITLEAWLGGGVFSEQWSSDALTNVCESSLSTLTASEVHWTCLTSPSCTLDYDVCWTDLSSGNSSGCTPTGEISDSTPSFIIHGLNSCTDYNITVSTTTVGGTYFEASVRARTPLSAESLRSLSAASVTNTSFVVQWEIPENSVRCGHSLEVCASNLYTNHKYCTSNATGSKWERVGLEACSLYDVTATLSVGHHVLPPVYISVATSRPSRAIICPEGWPVTVPDDTMLESMSVADMTRNNISVSWVPMYPGLPCSLGYQVCWGVAGVDPTIQACSSDLPRDARNFTIAGLRRRTNYTVQVMARFDGDVMSLPVQVVALTAVHPARIRASISPSSASQSNMRVTP